MYCINFESSCMLGTSSFIPRFPPLKSRFDQSPPLYTTSTTIANFQQASTSQSSQFATHQPINPSTTPSVSNLASPTEYTLSPASPPPKMRPTQALSIGRYRHLKLTTKDVNKGFYKGNRTGSMGRHTKYGGYVIEFEKVRTYVVPQGLKDFKVRARLSQDPFPCPASGMGEGFVAIVIQYR